MDTTVLKLVLTPVLIAAASLAQRRWGAVAGGLIVGLPLTSGPVAYFLAVDHGEGFAARAGIATIAGLVAEAAFCLAYAAAARRHAWPVAAAVACAAFAACLPVLHLAPPSLIGTYLVTLAILVPARRALAPQAGEPRDDGPLAAPPWWDLPARMIVATSFVLALTEASGAGCSRSSPTHTRAPPPPARCCMACSAASSPSRPSSSSSRRPSAMPGSAPRSAWRSRPRSSCS
jgi:hypothetical protein